MDIVGRRNWYFLLSLAIILPGIISMLFFGFRLGIDFAGGDQFNIAFKQPTSAAEPAATSSTSPSSSRPRPPLCKRRWTPSTWRPPYSRLVPTTS